MLCIKPVARRESRHPVEVSFAGFANQIEDFCMGCFDISFGRDLPVKILGFEMFEHGSWWFSNVFQVVKSAFRSRVLDGVGFLAPFCCMFVCPHQSKTCWMHNFKTIITST